MPKSIDSIMPKSFISIGTKLIALVLAVSIVSITITTIVAFNFADSIIKDNLKESLREESTVRGEAISAILEEQKSKLQSLTKNNVIQGVFVDLNPYFDDVTFSKIVNEKNDVLWQEIQSFQLNEFVIGLKDLKIVNHQGRLVFSLNENVQPHSFVTGDLRMDEPYIEFSHDKNKNSLVEFSIPIIADSEPVGVMVSTIDGSFIDDILLNRYGLEETGEVYLVNKEGVMITESPSIENEMFNQKVETTPVLECFQNGASIDGATYANYRGINIFGLSYCNKDLNFVILTEIDESVILDPILDLQQRIIIAGLTLIGAVCVITFVLSKRFTKPILELKNAANEISLGNFNIRTKIKTNDEIGQLSSSFDHMAKTIQETVSAITKRENLIRRQENILLSFFQEKEECCVCLVDLVGSVKITSGLSDEQKRKYFEIFAESVTKTVQRHQGTPIKFIDDAILFYFPISSSKLTPGDAVKCCLEISELEKDLNQQMTSESLPGISYRTSATLGTVNVAKTTNMTIQDIFGEPVNLCFKINQYALPNTVIIDQALYEKVKDVKSFKFTKLDQSIIEQLAYQNYIVSK